MFTAFDSTLTGLLFYNVVRDTTIQIPVLIDILNFNPSFVSKEKHSWLLQLFVIHVILEVLEELPPVVIIAMSPVLFTLEFPIYDIVNR